MKPKIPLARVVAELRELNWHYDGPGEVCLFVENYTFAWTVGDHQFRWRIEPLPCYSAIPYTGAFGREQIPGDGAPFDAVGAARRLLSDYRNGVRS